MLCNMYNDGSRTMRTHRAGRSNDEATSRCVWRTSVRLGVSVQHREPASNYSKYAVYAGWV
jgi:hypothetical protein